MITKGLSSLSCCAAREQADSCSLQGRRHEVKEDREAKSEDELARGPASCTVALKEHKTLPRPSESLAA